MPGFPVLYCLPSFLKLKSIESLMLSNCLVLRWALPWRLSTNSHPSLTEGHGDLTLWRTSRARDHALTYGRADRSALWNGNFLQLILSVSRLYELATDSVC